MAVLSNSQPLANFHLGSPSGESGAEAQCHKEETDAACAVPLLSPAQGPGWDADTSASTHYIPLPTPGAIKLQDDEVEEKQPLLMGYQLSNLSYKEH